MIPLHKSFSRALATVFVARKSVRRRDAIRRAATARHRFGMASRAALFALVLAEGGRAFATPNTTHTVTAGSTGNFSAATFTNGTPSSATAGDTLADAAVSNPASFTLTLDINVTIGTIKLNSSGGHSGVYNSDGTHTFTLNNTGGTVNNTFGNTNASIGQVAGAGTLTVNPDIIAAQSALDIGTSNAGSVVVGGNLTATTATTLNLRNNNFSTATGNAGVTISGTIGATGSAISINNVSAGTSTKAGNFLTLSGAIGGNIGTGAAVTINNAATTTTAQVLTISGTLGATVSSVTQNSNLTSMTVSGANTNYVGTTNLTLGTITAGANTNLGSVVMGGSGTAGTLNLNGRIVTVTGLTTGAGSTVASQQVLGAVAGGGLVFTTGTTEFDGLITGSNTLTVNSGTLTLNNPTGNSYTGLTTLNGGTLNINSTFALGGAVYAGLTFGANGGTLQYNSTLLNASTDITQNTAATPVAKNVTINGAAVVDTNGNNITYANTIGNNGAGSFMKAGTGTLTLNSTGTYTGMTQIATGTLKLALATSTNPLSSSSRIGVTNNGTLDVTSLSGGAIALAGGQLITGSGTVLGGVTVGSGRVAPGAFGVGNYGNLTVGSLTLSNTSQLDFDLASPGTLDQITVTSSGGLTINGGQLNINGATGTFTTAGVYNLIGYTGAVGGTGVSALTVNGTNKDVGDTYTFGLSGGYVTLTVASSGAVANYYVPNADGNYSDASKWSANTVPNAVGAFAAFGGSGSATLTANRTVTVDGAFTVGTLSLNSGNAFGYTLANGGAGLTLNNGASTAFITDAAGSHTIAAPLTLTPNGATATVISAADTLTISGVVSSDASGDAGLTKAGNGTLALTGTNTYFGGTSLAGGTIQINSPASLGDASGPLTFNGGTLQLLADVTSTRNYQVNGGNAIIDTNGHTLTLNGAVTPVSGATGGVVKNGLGTLALAGTNTFTGSTTVNAGTLTILADGSLGAVPGAAATNLTFNPGTGNTTTLLAGATATLNVNRAVVLNSGTTSFNTNGNNLTVNGAISGNGLLQKDGAGTLTLGSTSTYAGGTLINAGTLVLANNVGIAGGITIANGATFQPPASGSGNNLTISGTNANATVVASGIANAIGGTVTGTADQTLTVTGANQVSFGGATQEFATFLGTVEIPVGAALRFSATGLNNGGNNTTFDVNGSLYTRNNGAVALGALTGSGGVGAGAGGGNNLNATFTIGAKGIDSLFSGVLFDGDTANGKRLALVKTGADTLTLTGASTYTGATTVSAGTLQIGNGGTSGSLSATTAIADNANLVFNRSDAVTVSNTISGSGTLSVLGSGTTTFAAEVDQGTFNARAGTTVINAATAGLGLTLNALNNNVGPIANDNATVTVTGNGIWGANGTLAVGGAGTGTVNVNSGGQLNVATTLSIGNSATGVGTVNLNTGGTLTTPSIGSAGGTSTLNLNGGTLVAAPGASSTFIAGLTAANVQAGGVVINDGGNTVTISQALVHDPALGATADGGLTKTSPAGTPGILTLAAANTYGGGTSIQAGTLAVSVNGGLGTGNVTISAGATLSLATGVTAAHNNSFTTTLSLADATSMVNLAAATGTVQDTVGSLVINGTTMLPGLYGSSTSGALPPFQLPEFTGSGLLLVGVPEPSTWLITVVGLGGLGIVARRRKRCA